MEIKLKIKNKESPIITFKDDWKDIKGFEGLYKINSNGDIKSLSRKVTCKDKTNKTIKERIVKAGNNGTGYLFVCLWKNNISYRYYVHRLVAETFIENPDNLLEVNHIDNNKANNNVDNLEWCNRLWNERCKERHISNYHPKPIVQIDENNNILAEFESIRECRKVLHHSFSYISNFIKNNTIVEKNGVKYKLKYKL